MTRGGHHHAWLRCYSSCVWSSLALQSISEKGSGRRGGVRRISVYLFIGFPANYSIFELVAMLRDGPTFTLIARNIQENTAWNLEGCQESARTLAAQA
jgi:hypothetical protein